MTLAPAGNNGCEPKAVYPFRSGRLSTSLAQRASRQGLQQMTGAGRSGGKTSGRGDGTTAGAVWRAALWSDRLDLPAGAVIRFSV
jgi:hypothetical protein